jgi:hypothetical protein
MTLEYIRGKMAECMRVFTRMIRNMGMVFTHGLTRRNIQDGGLKESSTVLEYLLRKKEERRNMGCGRMARNADGSHLMKYKQSKQDKLMISEKYLLKTQISVGEEFRNSRGNSYLHKSFISLVIY